MRATISISISSEVLVKARQSNINISAAAEKGISEAVGLAPQIPSETEQQLLKWKKAAVEDQKLRDERWERFKKHLRGDRSGDLDKRAETRRI